LRVCAAAVLLPVRCHLIAARKLFALPCWVLLVYVKECEPLIFAAANDENSVRPAKFMAVSDFEHTKARVRAAYHRHAFGALPYQVRLTRDHKDEPISRISFRADVIA